MKREPNVPEATAIWGESVRRAWQAGAARQMEILDWWTEASRRAVSPRTWLEQSCQSVVRYGTVLQENLSDSLSWVTESRPGLQAQMDRALDLATCGSFADAQVKVIAFCLGQEAGLRGGMLRAVHAQLRLLQAWVESWLPEAPSIAAPTRTTGSEPIPEFEPAAARGTRAASGGGPRFPGRRGGSARIARPTRKP